MEHNQVDQPPIANRHPSGDQLEKYALGYLREPELGRVESHLFVCPSCQDELVETDEYVAVMKAALEERQTALSRWSHVRRWIGETFQVPHPAPALAAAASVLLLTVFMLQNGPLDRVPESEITLQAFRGGTEAMPTAPAGSPLQLKIQSQYVQRGQTYAVRIVDAAGRGAWDGRMATPREGGLSLVVGRGLASGNYWVRLYDAQENLLQEYGMRLQ